MSLLDAGDKPKKPFLQGNQHQKMKIIKKLCDGPCGGLKFIWKNSGGKRYCRQCWSAHSVTTTPKPTVRQKRLPPRFPKRIIEDKLYSTERRIFLDEHPMCEAHLPGICTKYSTDVHHKMGRIGELLLMIIHWLAVCRACHDWIENHPEEAREKGFSIKRIN